jgi:hypothetical protein
MNYFSFVLVVLALSTRGSTAASTCTTREYRQFDFFAGDWDTYDMTDQTKIVARNHVTSMVDGCALREVYEQNDGLRGESINTFDTGRRIWHQTWVTNRGQLLLLRGRFQNGRMTLTATERLPNGKNSLIRGIWWRDGANVRERARSGRRMAE